MSIFIWEEKPRNVLCLKVMMRPLQKLQASAGTVASHMIPDGLPLGRSHVAGSVWTSTLLAQYVCHYVSHSVVPTGT